MRSDTAFLSSADIFRRFLSGLTSDLLSAAAVAFLERGDLERAGGGADAPRIYSASVNNLDLGLEAVDLALAVGNCLCDDTHGDGRVVVLRWGCQTPADPASVGGSHLVWRGSALGGGGRRVTPGGTGWRGRSSRSAVGSAVCTP